MRTTRTTTRTLPGRALRRLGALATAAALAGGLLTTVSAPASAAVARDGLSAATALASCWDVKQVTPTAPSGVYWLWTPALPYPQEFYCDMTTDGGGWVLLGRGRENWSFLPEGQGATSEVASVVTGTAAFAPKLLSADTVNGLLNGTAVKDLADGVRIRRAYNTSGTSWQEVRVRPVDMGAWRWTISHGYYLRSITFNTTTYTSTAPGTTTAYQFAMACPNTTSLCLDLRRKQTHEWSPGFAYGTNIRGNASATSYLWQPATATGAAIPFAQLFVRPRVRWADLAVQPVAGLGTVTNRSMADNYAEDQVAGVSGQANGMSTERDTEVRSMAQLGDRMFVGGNFSQVDTYPTGSTPQRYLAAFDVATGAFDPAFRPTLNGKVNAVVQLPDGNLAVGGEFTTVNGQARAGLVVLDPATGATVARYDVGIQRRSGTTTSVGTVTGLDVAGGWLYLGGQFTHVSGGTSGYVYAKRGARIDVATSRPDPNWNPAFDGSPIFVLASDSGDRVYYGGFMATMNDGANKADKFAAVTTTAPARPVAGLRSWVPSTTPAKYQQTAAEGGNRLVIGGAEHALHFYDRSNLAFVRGNIARSGTGGQGGDFQASVVDTDVVYGSCHCQLSGNFGGSRLYSPATGYEVIDSLRFVGAYDLQTGRDLEAFLPWMRTRAVRGPWALTMDSNGCLWAGGDTSETKRRSDNAWQTSGGFARFCRNDSTAPTVPSALTSAPSVDGSTVTVSWTGSTDDRPAAVRYVLYRDDVPLAMTTSWKLTVPAGEAPGTYAVRAFDKAGNWSAASEALVVG